MKGSVGPMEALEIVSLITNVLVVLCSVIVCYLLIKRKK
jgi:hypothetical protein